MKYYLLFMMLFALPAMALEAGRLAWDDAGYDQPQGRAFAMAYLPPDGDYAARLQLQIDIKPAARQLDNVMLRDMAGAVLAFARCHKMARHMNAPWACELPIDNFAKLDNSAQLIGYSKKGQQLFAVLFPAAEARRLIAP